MSKVKLKSTVEKAISKADSSYFFEDYSKQAQAVLAALEQAGYRIIPTDIPEDTYAKAVELMKTGRIKPNDHIKDVFDIVIKMVKV